MSSPYLDGQEVLAEVPRVELEASEETGITPAAKNSLKEQKVHQGGFEGCDCRGEERLFTFSLLIARGKMQPSIEPDQNVLASTEVVG